MVGWWRLAAGGETTIIILEWYQLYVWHIVHWSRVTRTLTWHNSWLDIYLDIYIQNHSCPNHSSSSWFLLILMMIMVKKTWLHSSANWYTIWWNRAESLSLFYHTGLKKEKQMSQLQIVCKSDWLGGWSVGLVCGNDNGVDNTTAGNTHTCSLIGGHPSTTTRVMSHSIEQTEICTTDTILSVSQ